MQQLIQQFAPDGNGGSRRMKNTGLAGNTPARPDESSGDLSGMDPSDDSPTTVGAGGDLGNPGIGSLDDVLAASSGSLGPDDLNDTDGGLGNGTRIPTADLLTAVGGGPGVASGPPPVTTEQIGTGTSGIDNTPENRNDSLGTVGSDLGSTTSNLSDTDNDLSMLDDDLSGLNTDPDLSGVSGASQQPTIETQPRTQRAGKTALVTGASSGIGRELANLFAQDGYDVVLVARSDNSLQQIAREYEEQYGVRATVISQDLADPTAPEAIFAETERLGIPVDILVNNAGMGAYGLFATESDLQKELDIIRINSTALVHLTKLYLKDMVTRNDGKILLLGSVASVIPHPLMAVYGATKAFNYSFGEALRNELKDTNITVTVLMPPATDTDFFNKAGSEHTVIREQARSMKPAEVAKAGYDALMAGKDKVAAGLSAKMQVAMARVMPDPMLTQNMRDMLTDRQQAKRQVKQGATVAAVAAGVALLAGWWLSRNRTHVNLALQHP